MSQHHQQQQDDGATTTSVVASPFAALAGASSGAAGRANNAVAVVAQQREIAEVQAMAAVAKRFPRDQAQATDRIIMACTRPTLAEGAVYQYSRGGSDVSGPSIRLAEAIAQAWGNLTFGIRELEQRDGESTVEAYALDLETVTRSSKVFQVRHERHLKDGRIKRLTDPRDVYELVANQGARRLRACILALIPGDIVESAVEQCEVTMRTKVEVTPELLRSIIDKFSAFGVTREHIEQRIQRKLDAITPALVVSLGKILNSLRDGMSAPADWFDVSPPVPDALATMNDEVRAAKQRRAVAPQPTDNREGA